MEACEADPAINDEAFKRTSFSHSMQAGIRRSILPCLALEWTDYEI